MKILFKKIGIVFEGLIIAAAFLITAIIDGIIWIEEFYVKNYRK